MSPQPFENDSPLDLRDVASFDSRATRRAVRRGLVRTAITTVVVLLLGATVLQALSAYVAEGGGRGRHFTYVMDGAVQLAHPDYAISNLGFTNPGLTGNLTYTASLQPRAVGLAPAVVMVRVHRNVLRHVGTIVSRPPPTALYQALVLPLPNKDATRALLARMPGALNATVVVHFAQPLDPAGFARFAKAQRMSLFAMPIPQSVASESTALILTPVGKTGGDIPVLVWPNSSLSQFQTWAAALRSGDDQNLRALFLPKSNVFRRIAAHPRVSGFVLNQVPTSSNPGGVSVSTLLEDPAVLGVSLASAAFDLTPR